MYFISLASNHCGLYALTGKCGGAYIFLCTFWDPTRMCAKAPIQPRIQQFESTQVCGHMAVLLLKEKQVQPQVPNQFLLKGNQLRDLLQRLIRGPRKLTASDSTSIARRCGLLLDLRRFRGVGVWRPCHGHCRRHAGGSSLLTNVPRFLSFHYGYASLTCRYIPFVSRMINGITFTSCRVDSHYLHRPAGSGSA
jgi:hypothetical protein